MVENKLPIRKKKKTYIFYCWFRRDFSIPRQELFSISSVFAVLILLTPILLCEIKKILDKMKSISLLQLPQFLIQASKQRKLNFY